MVRSEKSKFNAMLMNAVAIFCALMDKLLNICQQKFVFCFINNALMYTPTTLISTLSKLTKSCRSSIKLSAAKSGEVHILVFRQGLKTNPKKVEAISKITLVPDFTGYGLPKAPDFTGYGKPLFNT